MSIVSAGPVSAAVFARQEIELKNWRGAPRASAHGAMRTTLNHAEDLVSGATREHEREEMETIRRDGKISYRYLIRHVISRAHCGIDVPNVADDCRAVY